jgi:hypothetical protein
MVNKITLYTDFLIEANLSSVTSFLKAQYNNIFNEPTKSLHILFNYFIKKIDVDKNPSLLYQKYLRANQNNVQSEINKSDSINSINKVIADEIKYFYFSLKPIVNKLQNDEFTMDSIFEHSKDKRLRTLMNYEEDRFSNAVSEYVTQAVIPQLKQMSGIDTTEQTQSTTPKTTTERINFNIRRILEADENDVNVEEKAKTELEIYKKSALNWINTSLFDLLKPKIQLLNKIGGSNVSSAIEQISNQMQGSLNDNAKKTILNKVINLDNNELKSLAQSLGLTEDETGKI